MWSVVLMTCFVIEKERLVCQLNLCHLNLYSLATKKGEHKQS